MSYTSCYYLVYNTGSRTDHTSILKNIFSIIVFHLKTLKSAFFLTKGPLKLLAGVLFSVIAGYYALGADKFLMNPSKKNIFFFTSSTILLMLSIFNFAYSFVFENYISILKDLDKDFKIYFRTLASVLTLVVVNCLFKSIVVFFFISLAKITDYVNYTSDLSLLFPQSKLTEDYINILDTPALTHITKKDSTTDILVEEHLRSLAYAKSILSGTSQSQYMLSNVPEMQVESQFCSPYSLYSKIMIEPSGVVIGPFSINALAKNSIFFKLLMSYGVLFVTKENIFFLSAVIRNIMRIEPLIVYCVLTNTKYKDICDLLELLNLRMTIAAALSIASVHTILRAWPSEKDTGLFKLICPFYKLVVVSSINKLYNPMLVTSICSSLLDVVLALVLMCRYGVIDEISINYIRMMVLFLTVLGPEAYNTLASFNSIADRSMLSTSHQQHSIVKRYAMAVLHRVFKGKFKDNLIENVLKDLSKPSQTSNILYRSILLESSSYSPVCTTLEFLRLTLSCNIIKNCINLVKDIVLLRTFEKSSLKLLDEFFYWRVVALVGTYYISVFCCNSRAQTDPFESIRQLDSISAPSQEAMQTIIECSSDFINKYKAWVFPKLIFGVYLYPKRITYTDISCAGTTSSILIMILCANAGQFLNASQAKKTSSMYTSTRNISSACAILLHERINKFEERRNCLECQRIEKAETDAMKPQNNRI